MLLLTIPGWYNDILSEQHITIATQPSWESVTFTSVVNETDCARILASRGITLDEANDCHEFAFTWADAANHLPDSGQPDPDVQLRIMINQALDVSRPLPTRSPWPDQVPHRYSEEFARWVPMPPASQVTSTEIGATSTVGAHPSGVNSVSLAEFGQVSLETTSTTAAGSVLSTDPSISNPIVSDDNVIMGNDTPQPSAAMEE